MAKGNGKSGRFIARRTGNLDARQPPTADLAGLYDEVLDAAIKIAGADMGVMYRFDEEHDCLRIVTSQGFSDHLLKYFAVVRRDTSTTCAAAFTQRIRVVVDDVSTSSLFRDRPELDVMHVLGVAAAHSTPIIGASGRLWGVFTTHFRAPQMHKSYVPLMLDCIAVELAGCLDRLASQPGGMAELRASTRRRKSFRLAGSIEQCPCHACAFFTSKEEEYRVMLPFMAEGFEAGDKLVNIIDRRHRDERLFKLGSVGIDTASAERSGQLELLPWEQAHVIGGRFDQHRMLADLERQTVDGDDRYAATRLWSNQEWALESLPGVEDIVEYEARFNYIWPTTNNIYVCVFDAKRFSAETMMQMMRTHPFTIIDGIMLKNELYVPPDEFLKDIRGQNFSSRTPS
jgi:hypothetical protein